MPLEYEIHEGLVIGASSGHVTDASLLNITRRLATDRRREPGSSELWDVSDYESFEITPDGIRGTVALDKRNADAFAGGRCAIVAPSDIVYGNARMYALLSGEGSFQICAFRSSFDAKQWLGV